jgi:hypothetical protein
MLFQYARIKKFGVALVYLLVVFLHSTPRVDAARTKCTEAYLRDIGATTITCNQIVKTCQTATGVENSVFYIGDSLGVGMVGVGDLLQKTAAAGFSVNSTLSTDAPNRKIGPSVHSIGGYNIQDTLSALSASTEQLDLSSANIVVVMLGTNPDTNLARDIDQMIEYIRTGVGNTTAKIYWVNMYYEKTQNYRDVNSTIQNSSDNGANYQVIDFAGEALSNTSAYPFTDQIHHNPKGSANKSDFVVRSLGGGTVAGSNGSCSRPGSGDYEKDAFLYLRGKYGPNIAAGIVANLRRESLGGKPMLLECGYGGAKSFANRFNFDISLLDPEYGGVRLANYDQVAQTTLDTRRCPNAEEPKSRIEQLGWGIVQWTPASKMIDPSRAAGKTDGEIESQYYQLDFLSEQLEGVGIGGTASNEKRAGDHLKATTTAQEAAISFAIKYERCTKCTEGNPEVIARGQEALDILAKYGSL